MYKIWPWGPEGGPCLEMVHSVQEHIRDTYYFFSKDKGGKLVRKSNVEFESAKFFLHRIISSIWSKIKMS